MVRALLAAALLAPPVRGRAPTTRRLHRCPRRVPQVLAELPHDPTAFTEGLEIDDGILYEGTGLEGRSQLRELDPETGAVRRSVAAARGSCSARASRWSATGSGS